MFNNQIVIQGISNYIFFDISSMNLLYSAVTNDKSVSYAYIITSHKPSIGVPILDPQFYNLSLLFISAFGDVALSDSSFLFE